MATPPTEGTDALAPVHLHPTHGLLTVICGAKRLPACKKTFVGLSRLFMDADLSFLTGFLKKAARDGLQNHPPLTLQQQEDVSLLHDLLHQLDQARKAA